MPLVVLRVAFGAVLLFSTLRFISKGWVSAFYINPVMHFPFFGWEWLRPLPPVGMYSVYVVMACCAFGICAGLFYRLSATGFLVLFSYCGLLDKTYYLNHYYLIVLIVFLLALVPANTAFSLDVRRKAVRLRDTVPAWMILLFQGQLAVIYFFAGLSKLTSDWLIEAMPLRIWLPAFQSLPLIGGMLRETVTAYVFSWVGALFDLSVVFLLSNKKTRLAGYGMVLVFHGLTAVLFQIGLFPWLMITATLIFFPASAFQWLLGRLSKLSGRFRSDKNPTAVRGPGTIAGPAPSRLDSYYPQAMRRRVRICLSVYFIFQVLIPMRFLLYPGKLLWTEEGYRFSWRVMLMEKGGTSFFYVTDPDTGMKRQVRNAEFLTAYQERMMETQPDMILQYSQKLKTVFQERGMREPRITVESYVTMNGHRSRLFIDSTVDLAARHPPVFSHLTWIAPFAQNEIKSLKR